MSSILLKLHIITGFDVTSKIWTKESTMKSDPKKYLQNLVKQNYMVILLNELKCK